MFKMLFFSYLGGVWWEWEDTRQMAIVIDGLFCYLIRGADVLDDS